MKRLMHMMMSVMNSTIVEPFKAGKFCFEMFAFGSEMFDGVGCFVAYVP
jgi:hypothetical protein